MGPLPSLPGLTGTDPSADQPSADRLAAGRTAGGVIAVGALAALLAAQLVDHPALPASFDAVAVVALCSGIACLLIRWDRIAPAWLDLIPLIATVEVALGVRFAAGYRDIAADYYLFVVVFAAYAFTDRRTVAAHIAVASAASALPAAYVSPATSSGVARAMIQVIVLLLVAGIVTLLRERLEARQRDLEELSLRDPLTGVGNYRLLVTRLQYEITRHQRSGAPLTVITLDLDGFKAVNDMFGHPVGDRVLCAVADALASVIRSTDTLTRQGGDEFAILVPDTSHEQAAPVAERIRMCVSAATDGAVTTSVGWATYPTDVADPAALIASADADLRAAKARSGRPRVTSHQRASALHAIDTAASG